MEKRSTSSSRRASTTATKIRLAGKGQEGPGGRGDAIVTIEIGNHRFFRREGANIRVDLPVTLEEAVLGAKVKVPTPEGPVMLTIPKGTTSGKVLRLKGRGFTVKDGKRGDQLVAIEIEVPPERRRAPAVRRKLGRRRQPPREPRRLAPSGDERPFTALT